MHEVSAVVPETADEIRSRRDLAVEAVREARRLLSARVTEEIDAATLGCLVEIDAVLARVTETGDTE